MHIIASLAGNGFHPAAWRAASGAAFPTAHYFQDMAKTAERGKLDAVLLGEPIGGRRLRSSGRVNGLQIDALPLLGSLIAGTQQIGLGATWAVDYTEPYNVARVFATLDHLAGGRTAWIVGLFGGADLETNFRHAKCAPDLDAYCSRAVEFIDLTKKLWDSWEDGGFLLDVPSGRFADPARVHPVNHDGDFFTVRGPLNVPRPPQGNPPLIQCDPGTDAGRLLAAKTADVMLLTCATSTAAQQIYRDMKLLTASQNRSPESIRILANLTPTLASSETEARRLADELDALMAPHLQCAIVEDWLGREAPDAGARAKATVASLWPQRAHELPALGLNGGQTLRDASRRILDLRSGLRFTGTPEQLVDLMETWIQQKCCDGFNIRPAVLPRDLDLFVEKVIPLMQARRSFRADYAGDTLREHLRLERFDSRYAA